MVAFIIPAGPNFGNPLLMGRFYTASANLEITTLGGTVTSSTAAGFWTELSNRGVNVDTNFTAGVAKQVLAVSGPALVRGVVGPTAGGAETTTFTIVRDGITYTIASPTLANTYRAVLGFAVTGSPGTLFGTTLTSNYLIGNPALTSSKNWINATGSTCDLVGDRLADFTGAPGLYCESSLTISITHSANVTGTANNERQSGVWYRAL